MCSSDLQYNGGPKHGADRKRGTEPRCQRQPQDRPGDRLGGMRRGQPVSVSMPMAMLVSLTPIAMVRMEHLIRFPVPQRDKDPTANYPDVIVIL